MTHTMKPVYRKLSEIGLSKKQVKKYLPDWWDDSIATTEAGFQESLWMISNTFHLDFSSLTSSLNNSERPEFRVPSHKFKHSINLDKERLQPAVAIALLIAKLTLREFDQPLLDLSNLTAGQIRKQLLNDGNQWVDFEVLANYCWHIGVPVMFVEEIPVPKMDGLAILYNNRPAIILTKKDKYGHLVFHLAHELGHVILGHLADNGMMIDKKISKNNHVDKLEEEANAFAIELLTGKHDTAFFTTKKYSPDGLATAVINKASQYHIDPLHIILNYGYSCDNFPLANKVKNILIKRLKIKQTDQEIAKKLYKSNIDIDLILDDEVVKRMIGIK